MKKFLKKFLLAVLIKVACAIAELLLDLFGKPQAETPESV